MGQSPIDAQLALIAAGCIEGDRLKHFPSTPRAIDSTTRTTR